MKYRAITENHLYNKAYRKGKKVAARNVVVYVLPDRHAWRLKKENPKKEKINRGRREKRRQEKRRKRRKRKPLELFNCFFLLLQL